MRITITMYVSLALCSQLKFSRCQMVTSKHPDDACVTNSEILDSNHQNKVESGNVTFDDSDLNLNPFSDNQSSYQINKFKISKTPEALKVISINCCSL